MSHFRRILVANRGEIAVRILRTVQQLGMEGIAVYPAWDRHAAHVRQADQAYLLPHPDPRLAYLRVADLIAIAQEAGAEAIHPGYGFLSEQAEAARAVRDAGLVWIGPTPEAIAQMGDKAAAKACFTALGIPVVPGTRIAADLPIADAVDCLTAVGYPVLIKPSAGGGGKGMRLVFESADVADALSAVRQEAMRLFGSADVVVERYIPAARHIEIQIACDQAGQGIIVGERDCSWQRRYQKVIEESPAVDLPPDLLLKMGQASLQIAQAVGYTTVGTVEWIWDPATDAGYALEMNTRIQVEHPVTEQRYGIDLVAWQIRLAAGAPLPAAPDPDGWYPLKPDAPHVVEARLYAEDPEQGFLPCPGTVQSVSWPPTGPDLRIDAGIQTGDGIAPYWDPLLAKIVASGPTRAAAWRRLGEALAAVRIHGVRTNQGFLQAWAEQVQCQDTLPNLHILETVSPFPDIPEQDWEAAAVVAYRQRFQAEAPRTVWDRVDFPALMMPRYSFCDWVWQTPGGEPIRAHTAMLTGHPPALVAPHTLRVDPVSPDGQTVDLYYRYRCRRIAYGRLVQEPAALAVTGPCVLKAPMTSTVVAVFQSIGDCVPAGAPLICVEAMKMEQVLSAPVSGQIAQIHCTPGQVVERGMVLITLDSTQTSLQG